MTYGDIFINLWNDGTIPGLLIGAVLVIFVGIIAQWGLRE